MIFTLNKTRISYAAMTFYPRPQILKSGVKKYYKYMSVCQQRVNASLPLTYAVKNDKRHTIFHSISGT